MTHLNDAIIPKAFASPSIQALDQFLREMPPEEKAAEPELPSSFVQGGFLGAEIGGFVPFHILAVLTPPAWSNDNPSPGLQTALQAGYRFRYGSWSFDVGGRFQFNKSFQEGSYFKGVDFSNPNPTVPVSINQIDLSPLVMRTRYHHPRLFGGLQLYLPGFLRNFSSSSIDQLSFGAALEVGHEFKHLSVFASLGFLVQMKTNSYDYFPAEIFSIPFTVGFDGFSRDPIVKKRTDVASPPSKTSKALIESRMKIEEAMKRLNEKLPELSSSFSQFDYSTSEEMVRRGALNDYIDLERKCAKAYTKMVEWMLRVEETRNVDPNFRIPSSGSLVEQSEKLLSQLETLTGAAEKSFGFSFPSFSPDLDSAYESQDKPLAVLGIYLKAQAAVRDFYAAYLRFLKVQSSSPRLEEMEQGAEARRIAEQTSATAKAIVKINNRVAEEFRNSAELENRQLIDFSIEYYNPFVVSE